MVEAPIQDQTVCVGDVPLQILVSQVLTHNVTRSGYKPDPCADDERALPQSRQYHLEQFTVLPGRAGNETPIAGHHVQLLDSIDNPAEMVGAVAESADAQDPTHRQRHRVTHGGRGQPFAESYLINLTPRRAGLGIHAFSTGEPHRVEG